MIDFKHLAIDGQKIAACANFRNNLDKKRAIKQLEKITKAMRRLLEQEPTETVDAEVLEERRRRLKRKQENFSQALEFLNKEEDETASVNIVDREVNRDGRRIENGKGLWNPLMDMIRRISDGSSTYCADTGRRALNSCCCG